jgi:hypothetical protein
MNTRGRRPRANGNRNDALFNQEYDAALEEEREIVGELYKSRFGVRPEMSIFLFHPSYHGVWITATNS